MLIHSDDVVLPATTSAPVAERRSARRVSLGTEITLGSDSNFFTGFTNDVSEGGVFVATVNLLSIGTLLDLKFTLAGGARIEAKGQVRWVRELDSHNPEVSPGLGIGFVEVPQDAISAIRAFTAQRDPMFFPDA